MEKLIKQLRELQTLTEHCSEQLCYECKNKELCDKYDNKILNRTYKETADAIEELIRRCEQFQYMPPPTWISIKNEIPKEKEEVLVVCKNGKMFVAEHLSNTYCNDGWNVIGPLGSKRRIGNNRVTHWMPLPQKPKGE